MTSKVALALASALVVACRSFDSASAAVRQSAIARRTCC